LSGTVKGHSGTLAQVSATRAGWDSRRDLVGRLELLSYPPAFGSQRLGDRLGPRGSARRWLIAWATAAVFIWAIGIVFALTVSGWGFGIGFAVVMSLAEALLLLGLRRWFGRSRRRSLGRNS
jgi:hypothetical protein